VEEWRALLDEDDLGGCWYDCVYYRVTFSALVISSAILHFSIVRPHEVYDSQFLFAWRVSDAITFVSRD
jgi:hypothetical protein